MKNKIQVKPQVVNKVKVTHLIIYAIAGIAMFGLLFTGAFFYFNLGNNEEAVAVNSPEYTSHKNSKGLWKDASTWYNVPHWRSPVPQIGSYLTMNIYGTVIYEAINSGDNFNIFNGSVIDIMDTLIVKGNANFGANINILESGVLIIFGNLNITAGTPLKNKGRVVITENLTTSDYSTISNNSSNENGFYVYGTKINAGGGNIGPNIRNEIGLKNNDIDLYNFVTNGGEMILPITLAHFNASTTSSKTVLIEWSTFSEKSNDFFTLERSADGKDFEVLTTIDGAGNSNKKLQYSFEDNNPIAGMNYYRLKQTDFNGDFEYFKIAGVNMHKIADKIESTVENKSYKTWPNPFKDHINIRFEAAMDGDVDLIVHNTLGEVVLNATIPSRYGENNYVFKNVDHLNAGIYYLTLWQDGTKQKTQRLIKI